MHAIYGEIKMLPRVSSVKTYSNFNLILTFDNGERKIFDAKPLLKVPMYKNLANVLALAKVEFGTVVWPGDLDVSPDMLYIESTALKK